MATALELDKFTNCNETIELLVQHLPSKRFVSFKRLKLTGFSDTVTPNWTTEAVYGRMDPIATYQNTTRAISLSFDLGPFTDSDDRAKLAMAKVTRLMQFQYPTYTTATNLPGGTSGAGSISRPPLLRIRFANYIRNGRGDQGLVCYLNSMAYTPSDGMNATSVPKIKDGAILPQRISVSLSLNVLHDQPIGWDDDSEPAGNWGGGANWGIVGFNDEAVAIAIAAGLINDDSATSVITTDMESTIAEQLSGDVVTP